MVSRQYSGSAGSVAQLVEQRPPRVPMVRPAVDQHPVHIEDRAVITGRRRVSADWGSAGAILGPRNGELEELDVSADCGVRGHSGPPHMESLKTDEVRSPHFSGTAARAGGRSRARRARSRAASTCAASSAATARPRTNWPSRVRRSSSPRRATASAGRSVRMAAGASSCSFLNQREALGPAEHRHELARVALPGGDPALLLRVLGAGLEEEAHPAARDRHLEVAVLLVAALVEREGHPGVVGRVHGPPRVLGHVGEGRAAADARHVGQELPAHRLELGADAAS